MTGEERSRLRALCEAATPGPWWTYEPASGGVGVCSGASTDPRRLLMRSTAGAQRPDDDAAFAAAARTALPALLDALDAAEARATTAERERDAAVARIDDIDARRVRLEEIRLTAKEILGATDHEGLCDASRRVVGERDALRAQTLVAVPLGTLDPRGLPCACDEWGPGHLAGCPNGATEPGAAHAEAAAVYSEVAALTAGPRSADGREVDDVGHGALHPTHGGGL